MAFCNEAKYRSKIINWIDEFDNTHWNWLIQVQMILLRSVNWQVLDDILLDWMEVNQYPLELKRINQSFEQLLDVPRRILYWKSREIYQYLKFRINKCFHQSKCFILSMIQWISTDIFHITLEKIFIINEFEKGRISMNKHYIYKS